MFQDENQQIDPNASQRKQDHIELAFESKLERKFIDTRFFYEPLHSHNDLNNNDIGVDFLNARFGAPIWVSSMTGGTAKASTINTNLARACGQFKLGMGLGSCRQLLYDDAHLQDFQVRHLVNDQPLYANLGIAQIESILEDNKVAKILELIKKLEADGLIVHINPLQEWLQPEGDRYKSSPITTLERLCDKFPYPIIVKEVGQGFGPKSMKHLLGLPITAIDFAANGGTNFSLLEMLRLDESKRLSYKPLANIGHDAYEMVEIVNEIEVNLDNKREFIISGGINTFLDGYYLINKIKHRAIYGQASEMLKHALVSYEFLENFINLQIEGLKLANAFLTIKS